MKQYMCIGTYTESILFGTGDVFYGKGKGVYLCSFEEGTLAVIDCVPMMNPSYLCIDEDKEKIYAVNEGKEFRGAYGGGVTQISYDRGTMRVDASFLTFGTDPCHVEISPGGALLSVANFADGSVSIFPLDNKGNICGKCKRYQHTGSSLHPIRQKGAHAHSSIFMKSRDRMFVPDLGIDRLKVYRYKTEVIEELPEYDIILPPGSGPRFGVFSTDEQHFYLINEISSQVTHFRNEAGQLRMCETVETLPFDFTKADNICSDLHLHPSGKFLYASNRGHDSIVVYSIEDDGSMHYMERVSCKGKTPRNFAIDLSGRYLLCGNQDSDTIAVFEIQADGKIKFSDLTDFPSPVCIRFFTNNTVWRQE